MRITVDETILNNYQLTIEEFLILYLSSKDTNILKCIESLLAKGMIEKDLFTEGNYIISNNVKEIVSSVIVESDKRVIDKDEDFIELATKLRELYPKGKKEGTTYMWRGSITEIAKRLKTLVAKYNYTLNPEQVIKATEAYVKAFNGNYSRMRLLKYFIYKAELDYEGNTNFNSDLLSIIENEDTISIEQDWTTTLV